MRELVWEITDECLNSCVHCSSCLSGTNSFPRVIDYRKLKQLAEIFWNAGFKRITLSGGEPVLHPQFNEVVNELSNLNFEINLYTSGVYPHGHLQAIAPSIPKVGKAIVSFFSYKEVVHDGITGNPGSFSKTLATIRELIAKEVNVEVNIVPMELNRSDMTQTASFLKSIGVQKTNILRLVKQGSAEQNWTEIAPDREGLARDVARLAADPNARVGNPFGSQKTKGQTCGAGHEKICVTYDGYILPCEVFKKDRHLFANIYENNLNLIDTIKRFASLSEIVSNNKIGCYYGEIRAHLGHLGVAA